MEENSKHELSAAGGFLVLCGLIGPTIFFKLVGIISWSWPIVILGPIFVFFVGAIIGLIMIGRPEENTEEDTEEKE